MSILKSLVSIFLGQKKTSNSTDIPEQVHDTRDDEPFCLTTLDLSSRLSQFNHNNRDWMIKNFHRYTSLKKLILDFEDQGTKNFFLNSLTQVPLLEELQIKQSNIYGRVSDQDLIKLASLQNLNSLVIGDNNLNGSGLKHLAALPNLRSLDIGDNPLSEEGFQRLGELVQLEELRLAASNWEFNHWQHLHYLGNLKKLKSLDLRGKHLESDQLAFITALPNLESLSLSVTFNDALLSEKALEAFQKATLKKLKIFNIAMTLADWRHLGRIESLEDLTLSRIFLLNDPQEEPRKFNPSDLEELAPLDKLRRLVIHHEYDRPSLNILTDLQNFDNLEDVELKW